VKVAVVIPCWNHGRLLVEALASVASQTLRPSQVIVVDDGSTDETAATAQGHPDVMLVRQEHSGTASARNAGLAHADADVVAFLDADDLWPVDSLEQRVVALREHDADGCFGVVEEFGDSAAYEGSVRAGSAARLPGSMLVTREALAQVGLFDTSLAAGEAIDWVLRFDAAGLRWCSVADVVLRRRVHADNTSRSATPRQRRALLEVARRAGAANRGAP
jgi:glycosyltransferase involved in cell wall biosynthesis